MNTTAPPFDVERVRSDFPQLKRTVYDDRPLVFLDSAATSLKPQQVIDRITRFYSHDYGTVRRGVYLLSQEATVMYEGTRDLAAGFLNAPSRDEVIFVRGVTEAMNLIAIGWGRKFLQPGDEILLTQMEHHSNIVPWQLAAAATGATVKAVPITDRGEIDLEAFDAMLTEKVKLVSVVHVSNGLGTINPVKTIAAKAHSVGALCVVDGAQAAPHLPIDVQDIGCDFYACSGHKMLGPTGAGLLWGRAELLDAMDPYQGGGEMIDRVSFDGSTWDDAPHKFEAGTPAFVQVIALGTAIEYLQALDLRAVAARDAVLVDYATEAMQQVPGLSVMGTAPEKSGLVAFTIDGVHPYDVGTLLDRDGICIRVGQHCVQPIMDRFGVPATARASFGVYTTEAEIDALVASLQLAVDMLA